MKHNVTLHGFPMSTYVRTAMMVCEEKGVSYSVQPLEFKQPSHFALHPFGKMPAMHHEGRLLFETAAIARYLDETFPGVALQPRDGFERARMEQWISAINDYLYQDLVHGVRSEDAAEASAALERGLTALDALEAGYAGKPYLAGDALSLADLFIAPILAYASEGHPKVAERIAGSRVLSGAINLLTARESFRKTQAA